MPDVAVNRTGAPEQVTISAEDVREVRGALAALPESQRTLVELAYYEGLTHSEIADQDRCAAGHRKNADSNARWRPFARCLKP